MFASLSEGATTLIGFTFAPFEEMIATIGFMPIEFFTNFAHNDERGTGNSLSINNVQASH
jgi:hypothetical protein